MIIVFQYNFIFLSLYSYCIIPRLFLLKYYIVWVIEQFWVIIWGKLTLCMVSWFDHIYGKNNVVFAGESWRNVLPKFDCNQNLHNRYLKQDRTLYSYKVILHKYRDDLLAIKWNLFWQWLLKKFLKFVFEAPCISSISSWKVWFYENHNDKVSESLKMASGVTEKPKIAAQDGAKIWLSPRFSSKNLHCYFPYKCDQIKFYCTKFCVASSTCLPALNLLLLMQQRRRLAVWHLL